MSRFRQIELPCPLCAAPASFELAMSVNGGRNPQQRASILDETFQRAHCETCGCGYRLEPEFTYLDATRDEWIAVYPSADRRSWSTHERAARSLFDSLWAGHGAAREAGRALQMRVVFGWEALREKLVASAAGISDVTLEVAKLAIVRTHPAESRLDEASLRLRRVEDSELHLTWMSRKTGVALSSFSMPLTLVAELERAGEQWGPLRDQVAAGPYTDLERAGSSGLGEAIAGSGGVA